MTSTFGPPTKSASRALYGFHAVQARIRQQPKALTALYADRNRRDERLSNLLSLATGLGIPVHRVDENRLYGLAGHNDHQGVVALLAPLPSTTRTLDELLDDLQEPPFLLLLDGIQDPHNLGACIRSADAFGVHAVIAPKDRAVGMTPVVAKVASGGAETTPTYFVTNLARTMRELRDRGIWLIGAHAEGTDSLFTITLSGAIGWVVGAEGSGLRRLTRELCDQLVRIPLCGTVSSLNVSVATGICLFATRRQMAKTHHG